MCATWILARISLHTATAHQGPSGVCIPLPSCVCWQWLLMGMYCFCQQSVPIHTASTECSSLYTQLSPLGWETMTRSENPSGNRYEHRDCWPIHDVFPRLAGGMLGGTFLNVHTCSSRNGNADLPGSSGRCCCTARGVRLSFPASRKGWGQAFGEKAGCRKVLFQAVWTEHEKWN